MEREQLSALVIGVGSIGERHLRCFKSSGLFAVAVCEQNPERRAQIGHQYECATFDCLEAALQSRHFDLAVVCTLANSHIPIATTCVENGLHVLIEKPLALSLSGVAELASLAATREKVVRVAYTLRAIPAFLELKRLISDGALGNIRHISAVSGQHFPTYRPAYRTIYYNSHTTGGGAIQDALTHQLHTVEWLAGPICRLFASASHQVLEGVDVEDTVNVNAELVDGTLVSFAFNQFQAPNETFLLVHGTRGSARLELHTQRVGTFYHGENEWSWSELPPEDRDQAFIRQAIHMYEAIQGHRTQLATLEEATQTLKVNIAALESARTRQEVILQ